MQDLISRKWLMECIDEGWIKFDSEKDTNLYIHLVRDIAPSAQPEIVKCKDCKHYGCILHSGTQFEYGECFGHEESDYIFEVKPDDYCSRAERRTDE